MFPIDGNTVKVGRDGHFQGIYYLGVSRIQNIFYILDDFSIFLGHGLILSLFFLGRPACSRPLRSGKPFLFLFGQTCFSPGLHLAVPVHLLFPLQDLKLIPFG
jgi:hypothetical protein